MTIRIETERLLLRPFGPADVEDHVTMMADPLVAKSLTLDGKLRPRPEEWRLAATLIGHWAIRGFGVFSVIERSTGAWLGRVGPWSPEGWPGVECGWTLKSAAWGKGFAPEAAIAAMRWTFQTYPALDRMISVIDPQNANSQSVARKVGETNTGEVFAFRTFKLDVWAAERESWLARFA